MHVFDLMFSDFSKDELLSYHFVQKLIKRIKYFERIQPVRSRSCERRRARENTDEFVGKGLNQSNHDHKHQCIRSPLMIPYEPLGVCTTEISLEFNHGLLMKI